VASLSVVLPAYNEEAAIAPVLDRLLEAGTRIRADLGLDRLEIIVVDDGSSDRTGEVAGRYGDAIKLCRHPRNRGYGAALKTGFDAATCEYGSFYDADGTCPPLALIELVRCLERGADVAVAARLERGRTRMPVARWFANKAFALLLRALSGESVTDTASGMRMFRKATLPKLYPLPDGMHLTPAMSAKCIVEGLKVAEIPIDYDDRIGESKLEPFADGLRFVGIMLDTVLVYNPLRVFWSIGFGCFFVALLLMIQPSIDWVAGTVLPDGGYYIYRSISALTLVGAGVNVCTLGLLASLLVTRLFPERPRRSLLEGFILRLRLHGMMGWTGLAMLLVAAAVAGTLAWEQFFGAGIRAHWSLLVAAASLALVGAQLTVASLLVRLLSSVHRVRQVQPLEAAPTLQARPVESPPDARA
jgi:glycosyltransferase involved in cell wall biosynthesis